MIKYIFCKKFVIQLFSMYADSTSIAYVLGRSFELDTVDFDDNKKLLTMLVDIIAIIIHDPQVNLIISRRLLRLRFQ